MRLPDRYDLVGLCLVLTFFTGGAAVFSLGGCSAKQRIGTAATLAQAKAASATGHIDEAIGTGEVGPAALPHLDDAKADIGEIHEAAATITDALPGVKDVEGWFSRLLTLLTWLIGGGAVVFVLFYFSPWFKPVINWTGAVLNLIPKPMRVDAQADASYIAEMKAKNEPPSEDAIRAIELKKLDARYKRVIDEELAAKGVT